MASLKFNAANSSTLPTADGATLIEIVGGKVQKVEAYDPFGLVLDTTNFEEYNESGAGVPGGATPGLLMEAWPNPGQLLIQSPNGGAFELWAYKLKELITANTFNIETYVSNSSHWVDTRCGLYIIQDVNNKAFIGSLNANTVQANSCIAGAWGILKTSPPIGGGLSTLGLKIYISEGLLKLDYNANGAGWNTLDTCGTLFTNRKALIYAQLVNLPPAGVTFDFFNLSGTEIYFANNPVVPYANQSTGFASAIIHCALATATDEDSTLRYKVRFGTGAWSSELDLAGIQALDDQTTDTGAVDIVTVHKNSSDQSDFTELDLPYSPVPPSIAVDLGWSDQSAMFGAGNPFVFSPQVSDLTLTAETSAGFYQSRENFLMEYDGLVYKVAESVVPRILPGSRILVRDSGTGVIKKVLLLGNNDPIFLRSKGIN